MKDELNIVWCFAETVNLAMLLLYIIAGCVLLCLGSAQEVVYDDDHTDDGHARDEYPNPTALSDYYKCRRKYERSYICDPDQVISELEGYPFTLTELLIV